MKLRTKSPTGLYKKLLIVVSIILVIISVAAIMPNNKQTAEGEPLITTSTNNPDESKPNADNYNWQGAPDEPKKIRISKISVDAYVQKSGVDQDNRIAVPNNVHLASWFADSQKPGQNGLSIIAGHVSGRTTDGVFQQLKSLVNGDEFEIELGNGEIKRYTVVDTKQVKEAESANYLFSQQPDVTSQLNLITCGGTFNGDTQLYEDRVIVSGSLRQ